MSSRLRSEKISPVLRDLFPCWTFSFPCSRAKIPFYSFREFGLLNRGFQRFSLVRQDLQRARFVRFPCKFPCIRESQVESGSQQTTPSATYH